MHDLDRTQMETELDALEADMFEVADETATGPFSEHEEEELASELMGISDEAELDQFLGKIFKKIGGVVGKIARPLGGVLKGIAKKALPFVGGALGSFIPIPGVGTAVGTALGSAASKLFEVDLEGLSQEDQEYELARRYVRLAGAAARHAAASGMTDDVRSAVRAALMAAARQHAPGLLKPITGEVSNGDGNGGRVVRQGRHLVIQGV